MEGRVTKGDKAVFERHGYVFTILIVVRVSQYIHVSKFLKLQALSMGQLLYVNYTSIELLKTS